MAPQAGIFLGLAQLGVQKGVVVDDGPRAIALANENVVLVAAKHEILIAIPGLFDAVGAHGDVGVDREVVSLNALFDDSTCDRFHSHSLAQKRFLCFHLGFDVLLVDLQAVLMKQQLLVHHQRLHVEVFLDLLGLERGLDHLPEIHSGVLQNGQRVFLQRQIVALPHFRLRTILLRRAERVHYTALLKECVIHLNQLLLLVLRKMEAFKATREMAETAEKAENPATAHKHRRNLARTVQSRDRVVDSVAYTGRMPRRLP